MRQLLQIPLLILAMLLAGAIGFRLLTGLPILECFYLAVVTLTTVGSREPEPLTAGVMVFTATYLACGLGVFTYSAFQFGQTLVNADLRSILERRRMEARIAKLTNHFIICGYGRMGATLCDYLHQRRQPFVIIDENPLLITPEMKQQQWLFLPGDATQDEVLVQAGVERARGLTAVLPTDADNLYRVLSSRLLSKDLQIVARASDERAAQKMLQAGATRVINPLSSGAIRMARFMLSPGIENFVEVAESEGMDWEIVEVQVPEESPLIGLKLSETKLREAGIMLLGVHRTTGEKFFPPPGHLKIERGDNLFAFGRSESMAELSHLIQERRAGNDQASL